MLASLHRLDKGCTVLIHTSRMDCLLNCISIKHRNKNACHSFIGRAGSLLTSILFSCEDLNRLIDLSLIRAKT